MCEHDLCTVCCRKPECVQCKRRLSPDSFEEDSLICGACHRKQQNGSRRTALDGIVTEYDITTSEFDSDFELFMQNNEETIMSFLQQILNSQM
jgi:hypothetical protein